MRCASLIARPLADMPTAPRDYSGWYASQNTHCLWSAAERQLIADKRAADALALEQINSIAAPITAPDTAMLDEEYYEACRQVANELRWLQLRQQISFLLSEAAIYAGLLALVTLPVWAGPLLRAAKAAYPALFAALRNY